MKLILTITTLATLLFSASVQAAENTAVRGLKMGRRGGKRGGMNMMSSKRNGGMMGSKTETYYSVISAAQEVPGCTSSALGNAIATVQDGNLCIKLSYDGLSGPELFSHIHGPAAIGETAPVIFTMALTTQKTQCFELTKDQMKELDDKLWYFNIHSDMCPGGEIRCQIIPV
jgi:hypothetical protein